MPFRAHAVASARHRFDLRNAATAHSFYSEGNRAAHNVCRSGGDCDSECPFVRRGAGTNPRIAGSLDDLRTAQDRLVQTEKLASLGQLTAGIAHEIKNPLNFVNNFSALSAELVDELDETLIPAPLDRKMRGDIGELTGMLKCNLEKVVQHGKRAELHSQEHAAAFARRSGEQRSADINTLVERASILPITAPAPRSRVSISRCGATSTPTPAPSNCIRRKSPGRCSISISNGFYAATRRKAENGDGTFEPVLSAATRNLGRDVEIRIRDNGGGIPPEAREKMFNPFFTTKPTGKERGSACR